MRKIFVAFALSLLLPAATPAQDNESRGRYFYKKEYVPAALPLFEESRAMLPSPVWDKNPEWVRLYWKAWDIAFSSLRQPPAGSPLVANWIDEGLFLPIRSMQYQCCCSKGDYGAILNEQALAVS